MRMQIEFLPRSVALAEGRESMENGYPMIHWRVTLRHDTPKQPDAGKVVWRGIYSQGIARHPMHGAEYRRARGCTPGYVSGVRCTLHDEELHRRPMLESLETGRYPHVPHPLAGAMTELPPPATLDVLHSLAADASAIDYATFEEWASDYGYDVDSRSAESTYRACLAIGLALRALLGDARLADLREEAANA